MEITNLTRDDVQSVLRCRAVNNNISAPVETRILLDIIRKIILGKLVCVNPLASNGCESVQKL